MNGVNTAVPVNQLPQHQPDEKGTITWQHHAISVVPAKTIASDIVNAPVINKQQQNNEVKVLTCKSLEDAFADKNRG